MRNVLPQRRRCSTFDLKVGSHLYCMSIGYYDDGRPGEIFLSCNKTGTELHTAARDSAIILSFALQHGCSLEDIRSALTRRPDGAAEGPLGVLLDYIADHPELAGRPL